MTRRRWIVILALLALAVVLRFAWLTARPPHHDEGVNGWMVERVLEQGYYAYDPANYHGPSYFYLLAGSRKLLGFGLFELRAACAVLGVAMCFTPLLLRRRLGWSRSLAATAVLVTSPTLVYYARYAIHETLLACLGMLVLVSLLRFTATGRAAWLLTGGAALAGMIATKETTVLFVAVTGAWLVGETLVESLRARPRRLLVLGRAPRLDRRTVGLALALLVVMTAIHVVLFTGFFRDPRGVLGSLESSIRAYFVWEKTGTGPTGHEKAWCYYLHLGVRYELVLYLLAAAGAVAARRDRVVRAFAVIGFGLLVAYSAIPYKMPWLPASWLALLAVPAGHGVIRFAALLRRELARPIGVAAAAAIAIIPPLAITVRSSLIRPADPVERLAYVHTSPDYNEWFGLIQRAADRIGHDQIRVVIDHDASWPLAWSLTPYRDVHWGGGGDADVLVVAVGRAEAVEAGLDGVYYRRQYLIRDAAEPAYVYFRRGTFARWLTSRVIQPGSGFTVIGETGIRVGAR